MRNCSFPAEIKELVYPAYCFIIQLAAIRVLNKFRMIRRASR